MNDEQYSQHCLQQFQAHASRLSTRCQDLPESDSLRQLSERFNDAAQSMDSLYNLGPALVDRLFVTYPDFAPDFPRELLWFLGGECLHYMPDEEITAYQQLDEMRAEAAARGEALNMREARASLMGLQ